MGLRFFYRARLAPYVTLNIGKRGPSSISAGVPGAHLIFGKRGIRASAGVPGSGAYYTTQTTPYQNIGCARAVATFVVIFVVTIALLCLLMSCVL